MTTNHRVLVPSDPRSLGVRPNGRSYPGTPGSIISVPSFDATVLTANGWTFVSESGPTTARPTDMVRCVRGARFFDESLGIFIVYDGATWRDAIVGTPA